MPSVNVTTSGGAPVIAANSLRTALELQNNSDTDFYIRHNGAVSAVEGTQKGLLLPKSGGHKLISRVGGAGGIPALAVYAVHTGTGNKELVYEEFFV